jgi:UDP-N-acetylmuramate--alanine ligase
VGAALIVDAVRAHRPVTVIAEPSRVVDHLLPLLRPGDLVLTLGAGDIGKVADELVAALQHREKAEPRPSGNAAARPSP